MCEFSIQSLIAADESWNAFNWLSLLIAAGIGHGVCYYEAGTY
jgi:hypothetical protein